tara:strand:+ start:488 stop:823 length:336 start_codon:yes stop_codon:yes gene_type:complete
LASVLVCAGHAVQTALPLAEYRPTKQGWHVALLVALMAVEANPAGQGVQARPPGWSLYVPAGQLTHNALLLEFVAGVNPGEHSHASSLALLPPLVWEFVGHAAQATLPAGA